MIFKESKGRVVSIIISIAYLVVAYFADGIKGLFFVFAFLIFPLACIWFGDEMGEWSGTIKLLPAKPIPGCFVRLGGWLLLLLPIIMVLIILSSSKTK